MRRRRYALIGVLAAAAALWSTRSLAPAARGRPEGPTLVGTINPRTPIEFSLVLRLPGQARLRHFLDGLQDPASPAYHHFIDAAVFGARFGLPRTVLSRTTAVLARDAVHVTASYPQRTALEVRATAGTIDRLFGLRLTNYRSAGGRRFHASIGKAIVPRDLRDAVVAVAGLNNAAVETDAAKAIEGIEPASAKIAYDINPLSGQHITGQGEKIAVIEFGAYQQSDLDGFDQQFGLPSVTPRNVAVDGGTANGSAGAVAEVDLDLEVAHEIAPAAQLLDYNAPEATPSGADAFGAIVDQIAADGQASVASVSWGTCEAATPAADIRRDEQAIEAAAARGITIVAASGDAGAYTCQEDNRSDHRLSVSWPSSSPFVLSVGGTSLSTTTTGGYQGETAWQDTLEQSGGGGGLSVELREAELASRPRRRQPVLQRQTPASRCRRECRPVVRLGHLHRRRFHRGRRHQRRRAVLGRGDRAGRSVRPPARRQATRIRRSDAVRDRRDAAAGASVSRRHEGHQPLLPGHQRVGLRHRSRLPRRLQPGAGRRGVHEALARRRTVAAQRGAGWRGSPRSSSWDDRGNLG